MNERYIIKVFEILLKSYKIRSMFERDIIKVYKILSKFVRF